MPSNDDIMYKLGGIESNIAGLTHELREFKTIMEKHTKEEMEIQFGVNKEHNNRITSLEKFRNYSLGGGGVIAAGLTGAIAAFWKSIFT